MKKIITTASLAFSLALSSPASGAGNCNGTLSGVITYGSGEVMVWSSWRNEFTAICNVNEARLGISTQTCWSWFAKINEAVTLGKQVSLYYSSLNNDQECATLPTYSSAPAPSYLLLYAQ